MLDRRVKMNKLLQEIQAGSEEAAQEFVREYGDKLRRIIRRRLEPRLRSKFDSQDILQDLYLSFFAAPPSPETFTSSQALFNYLASMARNKVGEVTRQRLVGQRYNLKHEKSLDGSASFEAQQTPGPDATPSEGLMAEETWQRMIQRMSTNHQKILELRRQGHTLQEVADQVGMSTKHVRRLLRHLNRGDSER